MALVKKTFSYGKKLFWASALKDCFLDSLKVLQIFNKVQKLKLDFFSGQILLNRNHLNIQT